MWGWWARKGIGRMSWGTTMAATVGGMLGGEFVTYWWFKRPLRKIDELYVNQSSTSSTSLV